MPMATASPVQDQFGTKRSKVGHPGRQKRSDQDTAGVMDWHGIKSLTVDMTGVSRDALHVLAGLGVQFFIALIVRRPLSSWIPWSLMLLAAVINELYDFTYDGAFYLPLWPEAVHDLWLTMAVPTILFVLARWAPGLLVNSEKLPLRARSEPGEASSRHGRFGKRSTAALAGLNDALLRLRSETGRRSQRGSRRSNVVLLGWRVDILFALALAALGLLVVLAMRFLR